jgi:hypothetical protein
MELERRQFYIYVFLKKTVFNSFFGSVWHYILSRTTCFTGRLFSTGSFFLIGWSPIWFLSGKIEFTLLTSRNLMFLIGLLKLNYLLSLIPFLEIFMVLDWAISWVLGVEEGRFTLSPYISSLFISFYSGLLYDPESPAPPCSIRSLFFLSYWSIFTNGDELYYFAGFFLVLKSKDWSNLISWSNWRNKAPINAPPSYLYYFGVNYIFLPSLKYA